MTVRTHGRLMVPLRRLIEVLSKHRGEAAAITGDDIATILGVKEPSNRSLREALDALIEDGYAIGSTSRESRGGYFLIETEAELARAVATLRSRITAHERKIAALERAFQRGVTQPELLPAETS